MTKIVTGPYTTKNEPTIEDQRLDRARPVMYLDRRTYRGDPPAWLPTVWSKPGIYPLTPESMNVIQTVASFPFDRNAVTPSSSSTTTNMFNPSMVPNYYQQQQQQQQQQLSNMYYGGGMMMPMTMPPLLLQMLQYQQQAYPLQQQPSISSPVPMTSSPSSSYTQRKPINIPTPMPQPYSPIRTPQIKDKKAKQPMATTPQIQRKQVKSTRTKKKVRFSEAEPEIRYFEKYLDACGLVDTKATGDASYPDDTIYQTIEEEEVPLEDDDDDDTIQSDAYEQYDEDDYDQRHYPDHQYYNSDMDDPRYHRTTHYDEEGHHPSYRTTHYEEDRHPPSSSHYTTQYEPDDQDDRYYYYDDDWEEPEEEIQRPWSTGRYIERPMYYSPITRHHSARTSSSHRSPPRTTNPRMWQPSRVSQQQWQPSVSRSSSTGRRYRPPPP